ncbi:hypothetical protein [Altererythrobacter sp. TH136]|uniref:hypothetical protein n=1 Tax=Altererythrobacter sp. TH136 TaxID=2067415 RepID=UPI00116230AF|nr:hypothetical protein [Altererythrobacter sp. TH136]QDM40614.1 hypothetical protein C0V74_05835 [Altererythrobacter sp. TH136]
MSTEKQRRSARKVSSRLGCWWRSWIVFTVAWVVTILAFATLQGAWDRSVLTVVLAAASYPVLTLLIGSSIAWVIRGMRS